MGIQFLPLSMFDVAGVHAVHDRSIGSAVTGTILDTVSDEHTVLRDVPAFDEAGVHAVHDRSIGPYETGAIVDPVSYEYGVMQEKSVILGKAMARSLETYMDTMGTTGVRTIPGRLRRRARI